MTVQELIDKLSTMPPTLDVQIYHPDRDYGGYEDELLEDEVQVAKSPLNRPYVVIG